MGKLKDTICYTIGGIDRVADAGAGWRNQITPYLKELGVKVCNPLSKPVNTTATESDDDRANRKIWKENGEWDKVAKSMKAVRTIDLRFVDKADFIIGKINPSDYPCGSYEELFLANRQRKPILLFNDGNKADYQDWLFGTIPHEYLFSDMNELMNYLYVIDNLPSNIDVLGRWVFLNNDLM